MGKKILVILLLSVIICTAVSAGDGGIGLTFTGRVAPIIGIGDYLRGGAIGGSVLYNLFGIGLYLGVETYFEYDMTFNVAEMPINAVLGLGRNFWIMAGTTIPFGTPTLDNTAGDMFDYTFSAFPNTYGLGARLFTLDIPDSPFALGFTSEITFTVATPISSGNEAADALSGIGGFFAGLKAYIGVDIDFKI